MKMKHVDHSLDGFLENVGGLRWLPWVGEGYRESSELNLFIVGESHYAKATEQESIEEVIKSRSSDRFYTRKVVHEAEPLLDSLDPEDKWTTPTLSNIPRTLFGGLSYNRKSFWTNTVYFNLVQRLVNFDIKEQVGYYDCVAGWRVYAELIKVFKPAYSIHLGSSCRHSIHEAMRGTGVEIDGIHRGMKIGRCYAYEGKLTGNDFKTELIILPHPGSFFSHSKWHQYLKTRYPELTDYLRSYYSAE